MLKFSRRSWLRATGLASLAGGLGVARQLRGQGLAGAGSAIHEAHSAHDMGTVGRTSPDVFNASTFLRSWNFNDLLPDERAKFYRETPRPDGTLLREYEIFSTDREIEIAPGIFFPAWTYNGQFPGPTIRATEGDRLRVTFRNAGTHPHTIHFHG